jgi:hypothetical protein
MLRQLARRLPSRKKTPTHLPAVHTQARAVSTPPATRFFAAARWPCASPRSWLASMARPPVLDMLLVQQQAVAVLVRLPRHERRPRHTSNAPGEVCYEAKPRNLRKQHDGVAFCQAHAHSHEHTSTKARLRALVLTHACRSTNRHAHTRTHARTGTHAQARTPHTLAYARMHARTPYTRTYARMHARTHRRTLTCTHARLNARPRTHDKLAPTHARTSTHARTHTHAHTHTRTHPRTRRHQGSIKNTRRESQLARHAS